MSQITITESELRDALAAAVKGTQPADALTTREMAEATGVRDDRIRDMLRVLQREGRVTVHRVKRTALDGRSATVVAYTIAPAKKKAKA